jgi:hypothetical protein
MKKIMIAACLAVLASSPALAQNGPASGGGAGAPGAGGGGAAAPLPTPKPAMVASAEYSTAFCIGWRSAVTMEQQRFQNWKALIMVGRTQDDKSDAKLFTDSAAIYVLLPSITGKVTTNENIEVDCTPPAAPEPEKKP